MRVTEIRGLPVIDPGTARRVGTVADVIVDQRAGRVAALALQAADGAPIGHVVASQVRRVGHSAVMLRPGYGRPEPADAADFADLLDLASLQGLEVLGEDGNRMGTLCDVHVNPDSLIVDGWEMEVRIMERWLGGGGRIAPNAVVACSRDLMIVRAARKDEIVAVSQASVEAPAQGERERELVGAPRHNGSH